MKQPAELGWHFVGTELRDGTPVPADGVPLEYHGRIAWCTTGLYAGFSITESMRYGRGFTLCRVLMENVVQRSEKKMVARKRTILWRIDAEAVIKQFARHCALEVISSWDPKECTEEYLKTGNPRLRALAYEDAFDCVEHQMLPKWKEYSAANAARYASVLHTIPWDCVRVLDCAEEVIALKTSPAASILYRKDKEASLEKEIYEAAKRNPQDDEDTLAARRK